MSPTPDRRDGPLYEEEIILEDRSGHSDPEDVRTMRYKDGAFRMVDGTKTFDPRLVDRDDHKIIDNLVHAVAEDSYSEPTYSGVLVTNFTTWETSGKTKKIREVIITYTGVFPTTVVSKQYDSDGVTVVQTLTSTIVYSGAFVQSITTVES